MPGHNSNFNELAGNPDTAALRALLEWIDRDRVKPFQEADEEARTLAELLPPRVPGRVIQPGEYERMFAHLLADD